jgi:hypothetical protein
MVVLVIGYGSLVISFQEAGVNDEKDFGSLQDSGV